MGIGGWRLKAVGDTLYGYGFPDRMFKVNTDGTDYSVLQNGSFPNVNFPEWGRLGWNTSMEYSTGCAQTVANDRTTNSICRMNTDGTGFTMLKSWSHNQTSAFFVQILVVAGGGIYGVVPSNLVPGEEGGFLFRMNTDGSGFAVLHEFSRTEPLSRRLHSRALTVSDGVLYGFDYAPDMVSKVVQDEH